VLWFKDHLPCHATINDQVNSINEIVSIGCKLKTGAGRQATGISKIKTWLSGTEPLRP